MTHYVLIDHYSGYVWGETDAESPVSACRIVDKENGDGYREYEEVHRLMENQSGYWVFEAPENWIPVYDGQDEKEIERVIGLPLVTNVAFYPK